MSYDECSNYGDYDSDLEEIRAAYGERYERHARGEDEYGVSYYHSDDDEDGSESDESEESDSEEMEEFILNFQKGNYDDDANSALDFYENPDRPDAPSLTVEDEAQKRPNDWDERKAAALESLKSQLQFDASIARTVDIGCLHDLRLFPQYGDGGPQLNFILPHDESLNSTWTEFESDLSGCPRIPSFSIKNIQLNDELMRGLAAGLKGKVTTLLEFKHTDLSSEGIVTLANMIEGNRYLKRFILCLNMIDLRAATTLSGAWKSMSNLQEVVLTDCKIGDNTEVLSTILQSNVRSIDLSNNNISSSGAVVIAEYIGSNSPMKSLMLQRNNLNDNDLTLFAQALRKNTNLTAIALEVNRFTISGAKSLFGSIFDSASLNAISESNHTCNLFLFSDISRAQGYLERVNMEYNRKDKILIALHEEESLLRYLSDVPVELMPEVLAFIQEESNYWKKVMNMMYVTMRWWNMPSLYSYHGVDLSSLKRKRETSPDR